MSDSDEIGSEPSPFRVGVLPIPGFALMSYACTTEPMRAANLLARRKLYEVTHFVNGALVRSSGAAQIVPDRAVGETPDLDLLLVIAGGDPSGFDDARTLAWLGRMARRGVQLGGVSGGPVILARAGLMAGRRMTVHWEHVAALSETFPDLMVERRLYVIDRDRVTCGGGTAPLDLMHALISEHHGSIFARLVSDWFLHTDIRAPAAPQRAGLVERLGTRSAPLLDAVAAMEDHIGDPLTLTQLALIAGVSSRQLNRLFNAKFGESTMAFYRRLRIDTAQRLLGSASMRMADLATATGFSSAAHLSRVFTAELGIPPSAVRR